MKNFFDIETPEGPDCQPHCQAGTAEMDIP